MAKLIGTDPNQVPTNADLGTIAYQDSKNTVLENAYINAKGADGLEMGEDYSSPNNSSRLFFNSNTATGNWAIFNNSGDLIFKSSASAGSTSGNYTALSLSTSNVSIGGNLVLGNGNGIDFSATSNGSGTTSSELLDDYEEGTWTPSDGTAAGLTISVNHATYTRIGRVVHVKAYILIPTNTSGTNIKINGLPYTNFSSNGWCPALLTTNASLSATRFIRARANETTLDVGTSEGDVSSTWSDYSNQWMIFSLVYSTT